MSAPIIGLLLGEKKCWRRAGAFAEALSLAGHPELLSVHVRGRLFQSPGRQIPEVIFVVHF
jgi:hypothetical protein